MIFSGSATLRPTSHAPALIINRAAGIPGLSSERRGGITVVAWARLAGATASSRSAPTLVDLYQKHGPGFVHHVRGDFAVVVWDEAAGRLLLARDPTGIKPLYYVRHDDTVTFGATVADLRDLLGETARPNPLWLIDYLAGVAARHAALEGVSELPRGHMLVADRDGVSTAAYHHWRDDAPWRVDRDPAYVDRYRRVFVDAVEQSAGDGGLVAENSGGLDSASVIGVLARDRTRRIDTFGLPEFSGDERHMRTVATVPNVEFTLLGPSTLDQREDFARMVARFLGHPPVANGAMLYGQIAQQAARLGARTVYSGHGGDHAVTYRGRLLVHELVDHGNWLRAYRATGATSLRAGGRALLSATTLMRHRRNRARPIAPTWPLRAEAQIQVSQAQRRLSARMPAGFDTINEAVLQYYLHEGVTRRAMETTIFAGRLGLQYAFPLLDPGLIQCYLSTPAIEKTSGPYSRFLHRRALAGYVDPRIVWVRPKNEGESLPMVVTESEFGRRTNMPLREILGDGLAGPLADIVDLDADAAWDRVPNGQRPRGLWNFRVRCLRAQQWIAEQF